MPQSKTRSSAFRLFEQNSTLSYLTLCVGGFKLEWLSAFRLRSSLVWMAKIMHFRRSLALACLFLGLALPGCGGGADDLGALVPVEGTVTQKGTPLSGVMVNFIPDEVKNPNGKTPAFGMAADGKYKLVAAKDSSKFGAPAGWYKVTISAGMPAMGADNKPGKMVAVSGKYADVKTTPFSIEVAPNAPPERYVFDLKD